MRQTRCALSWLGGAALVMALVGAGGPQAGAQATEKAADSAVLWTDTFDTNAGGWITLGPSGKASVTTEAAQARMGKGALAFAYHVGEKAGAEPKGDNPGNLPIDILLRPTPNGELAKMRSLRFWVRADDDVPLVLALSEKGGGRYITLFWLPKDSWQQVTLTPGDFWLSDDKNDPKDPDDKLDLDQVENIGLVSIWAFLALGAGDTPESVAVFARHMGAHTLWLDEFTASAAPPAEAPAPAEDAQAGKGFWIDDLRRDVLTWFPFGDAQLRLEKSGAPFKGRALRVDYQQAEGKYVALIRDMRRFDLTKSDRLTFETASAKSAKIVLSLEEKGGAKYNALLDIPGDSVPIRKSVSFADFTLAEDSPKDENGHLDLDQLKTLTLVDITGAFGIGAQKNTLWIGPLRALTLNL
ncbi:MAG TPA: hypothetical protein VFB21_07985 [Chthonomonadaceae bacterium]|nr:hypothetical protein [Chthonomonadaceae bacterium]